MTLKQLNNHTGKRIGNTTIIRKHKDHKVHVLNTGKEFIAPVRWLARCDCGHEWLIPHSQITDTTPRSCKGCAPKNRESHIALPKGKHHKKSHPSYGSWYSMIRRCTSAKHVAYHNYGGRGITVCERWLSFDAFVEDMGIRPNDHSIERNDNNKGYEPSNCRWATAKEQRANQRPRQNHTQRSSHPSRKRNIRGTK
jgi:hypothetical protein